MTWNGTSTSVQIPNQDIDAVIIVMNVVIMILVMTQVGSSERLLEGKAIAAQAKTFEK